MLASEIESFEKELTPHGESNTDHGAVQHFVRDLKESFWGDVYGKTRWAWERFGKRNRGGRETGIW